MVALYESPGSTYAVHPGDAAARVTSHYVATAKARPLPTSAIVPGREKTEPSVNRDEKGDEQLKDFVPASPLMVSLPPADSDSLRAQAARKDAVRDLVDSLHSIIESCETGAMATEFAKLKRALSGAHSAIAPYEVENNFLSAIVQLESFLSQEVYKKYTRQSLELVRDEFIRLAQRPYVDYDDYVDFRRRLRTASIQTSPIIKVNHHEYEEDD